MNRGPSFEDRLAHLRELFALESMRLVHSLPPPLRSSAVPSENTSHGFPSKQVEAEFLSSRVVHSCLMVRDARFQRADQFLRQEIASRKGLGRRHNIASLARAYVVSSEACPRSKDSVEVVRRLGEAVVTFPSLESWSAFLAAQDTWSPLQNQRRERSRQQRPFRSDVFVVSPK